MIVVKTPLRVSFFGGGTDFPDYFLSHGGAVLGTAIDKHIFHLITRFPSKIFDYSIRLAYRNVERVTSVDHIQHVPFREILKYYGIKKDIEISITADLPSFSGLGSSSAFTTGLLKGLYAFEGKFISCQSLAEKTIQIERQNLKETVGYQDQIFAAFGGFNLITFEKTGKFSVERISLHARRQEELEESLMLFYTGITRKASDLEKNKMTKLKEIVPNLKKIRNMVDSAHSVLTGNSPLSNFGKMLDQTWREKKKLDSAVSNNLVDKMYETALAGGALGGKLLGAGGGGFMLLYVPVEKQKKVRKLLKKFYETKFRIDSAGSTIVHSA